MVFKRLLAVVTVALAVGMVPVTQTAAVASEVVVVPPGNQNKKQPRIFKGSRFLTFSGGGTFKTKYAKVYNLFANNPALVGEVKRVAAIYGIDPIHMIGAIVGEHTYNIDTYDSLQAYYVKALQYVSADSLVFANGRDTAQELFARPQFSKCNEFKSQYYVWDCRQVVWEDRFMGRFVDGKKYPRDRLHRVYFGPLSAGQTFGLGQLSPVAALSVTDVVSAKGGLPRLSIDNASQVYEQILNPESSLHYVAANIKASIDAYQQIAGYDISQNPGITATLYNLGNAATRARALKAENQKRAQSGKAPKLPEENFYGWLINDREAELRRLL